MPFQGAPLRSHIEIFPIDHRKYTSILCNIYIATVYYEIPIRAGV